ncbi:C-C motif chemokine 26-like [Arapaima gigas]
MARLGMTILALLAFMVVLRESTPKGCCTSYNEKPFPVKLLEKFKKQGVQGTCNINAAIFTTKLGKKICANSNDKWVQRAIEVIKSIEGSGISLD